MAQTALIAALGSPFVSGTRDGKEVLIAEAAIPGEQPVSIRIIAPADGSAAKLLQPAQAGNRFIVSGPLRLEEDGSLPVVTALVACPATEDQFLNEVLLVGRVGSEARDAESGKSTKRSIAVNRYRRDVATGEFEELTDWYGTRAFGFTKDKLTSLEIGSLVEISGILSQLTNAKGEPYCEVKARSVAVHKGRGKGSNPAKGTQAAGYSASEFEGSSDDIPLGDW